ncbi:thioesterase II family protein [Wukongibacter sp. M2B1]|uniref:thioesterase II family protein n=1 Tax=Wukongibacter sp. M2B1 TaxID=3088895 RepID=UPI003D7B1977
MEKIRLYCIPYAGGSTSVFTSWSKYIGEFCELIPIELAGKGKRRRDKWYNDLQEAVDDVYEIIRSSIDEKPYVLFGHSLGSYIVYLLYSKLKRLRHREPLHLFISGWWAEHIVNRNPGYHDLPLEQFKAELFKFGGVPEELLNNTNLLEYFIPVLRQDFCIIEQCKDISNIPDIYCDISILYGKKDANVNQKDISQWYKYAKKECNIYNFDGGHIFINENMEDVVKVINKTLNRYIRV